MDVSTVKAEVKAWERSFKSANGRDPTVQDIKNLPEIAAKYKLYKKLSKTSAASSVQSSSTQTSSEPPTTPPRSRPRSHQLGQTRLIETTAPLSSFNPFSPQKNKGKEKASHIQSLCRPNHLTSPFKSKKSSHDSFSLLDLDKPSTSSHTPPHSPIAVSSALSRARKRLRGDPVSPSPNKEKRRRVGSQSIFPFKLGPDLSESSDEEETPDGKSSFISDSPMKAPSGVKSFKLLFDETTESKGGPMNGKLTLGRTTTQSTSRGLFGGSSMSVNDDDPLWDVGNKHKSTLFKPSSVLPPNEATQPPEIKVIQERKSVKRLLSDLDTEDADAPQQSSFAPSALIPPSPLPAESFANRQKQFNSGKGKGKIESNKRKKAKTTGNKVDDQEEESTDDSDTLLTNVKIIKRTQAPLYFQPLIDTNDDSDPDPVLGYPLRAGHEAQPSLDAQEGRLEVNLPDKLRRMLALDTTEPQARYFREKRLVKSLVLGQRLERYDPAKGGEIWGVGEDDVKIDGEDETWRDTEGEDDWEGEPVPWAIGEL